jgi:sterol 24-C-methyltransferase
MKKKLSHQNTINIIQAARTGVAGKLVSETVKKYQDLHSEEDGGTAEKRKSSAAKVANLYYDLVTDFYQYGWGDSFHFAPRYKGESFQASLKRHELFLAHQMNLQPSEKVLDVGCGVGGPMKAIAIATGSRITGLNNNSYQIDKAKISIKNAGLESVCDFVKGDFMDMSFEAESFDAVYQIEATAHTNDKRKVFGEIYRTLKPGGIFGGYEWCLTDLYDCSNPEHSKIKKRIEIGGGLPDIATIAEVQKALVDAGFEILEARDVAPTSNPSTPWYLPLTSRDLSLRGFARSGLGRAVTHYTVQLLEKLRIAPQGSTEISSLLSSGADAFVASGELGIFTPMYFYLAKKPN